MTSQHPTLPPAINFHLWRPCNMRCRFCFATFEEAEGHHPPGHLSRDAALHVVRQLAETRRVAKLTFAGGEPTLCPHLEAVVREAKAAGLVTMLVTNGSRPEALKWVFRDPGILDWVAISLDSSHAGTNASHGRAVRGVAVETTALIDLCRLLRAAGVRIKLNTVVTAANVDQDLTPVVAAIRPERWKVLQVLPVAGQNDGVEDLLISRSQFESFVGRHQSKLPPGVQLVPEDNTAMRGSYAMVDPGGRFFDNVSGRHRYSRPILEVGVDAAWREVSFSEIAFENRGGEYEWGGSGLVALRRPEKAAPRLIALTGHSACGKDTVASILAERGFERLAIADPLKRGLREMLGLSDDQLCGSSRNDPLPDFGKTPRELSQLVTDALTRVDRRVWIRRWRAEIEARLNTGRRTVCTDVRTVQELDTARRLGATTVRIVRPGQARRPGSEHPTETQLRALTDSEFDVVIRNEGSLADLEATVRRVLFGETA